MKTLAEKIKTLRKKYRISQAQLSSLAGIDRSYLARLETGRANPSIRVLSSIALALHVSLIVDFQQI